MKENRVFNFNPGPAAIPLEVLEEIQEEFLNFKGSGMSITEISHRSNLSMMSSMMRLNVQSVF